MDELFRGQRIGKYEILTQLTLGGMAEFFLAMEFVSGQNLNQVSSARALAKALERTASNLLFDQDQLSSKRAWWATAGADASDARPSSSPR